MSDHLENVGQQVVRELAFHIGEGNAIDRWVLVVKLFGEGADIPQSDDNNFDRTIRRAVELMRRQGHLICNLGNGRGWFLAANEYEYQSFRAVYGSHAFPIMETIRNMDKAAQAQWPNALQPPLL